jgi:ATP-binding cassette subfamily C protein LapB
MDTQTEAAFIADLAKATEGHTLVVVTHRPSLLQLVNRIIVVDGGKIAADGPKDQVLAALRNPGQTERPAQPEQPPQHSAAATENAQ